MGGLTENRCAPPPPPPPSALLLIRWEQARILQGCPAPGKELTEDYNPLEAGLCHAVSLAKVRLAPVVCASRGVVPSVTPARQRQFPYIHWKCSTAI